MIEAPGFRKLTTALYPEGDAYLTSDPVFGVKKSLVVVSNTRLLPGGLIDRWFRSTRNLWKSMTKQRPGSVDSGMAPSSNYLPITLLFSVTPKPQRHAMSRPSKQRRPPQLEDSTTGVTRQLRVPINSSSFSKCNMIVCIRCSHVISIFDINTSP